MRYKLTDYEWAAIKSFLEVGSTPVQSAESARV